MGVLGKVVLVTGSRNWRDWAAVWEELERWKPGLVIHGAARGADHVTDVLCKALGIPTKPYPAQWDKYGKSAGPIRNQQMLDENPDIALVIAFPLPASIGTWDMVRRAGKKNIDVVVHGGNDDYSSRRS